MDESIKNPVISIVLPVYNGQRYLAQAIESCLDQTFKDFELIVVDDKSTDNSLGIMEEWAKKDSRIKIVKNLENKKLPASLNVGFDYARGEYYTWTSDDNVLEDNFLETMLKEIKKNSVDIVYSNYVAIGEDGQNIEVCCVPSPESLPLAGGIGASFLYRREVHEVLRGYDTSLFLLEDYDFWVRAYLMGFKFFHIVDVVPYRYRRHGASLTETAKSKIIAETIKYKYKLRKKLKLDRYKATSMRINLLKEGRKILSFSQQLLLILEISFSIVGRFFLSGSTTDRIYHMLTNFYGDLLRQKSLLLSRTEKYQVRFGFCTKLSRIVKKKYRIGFAVLAHERPEYLEICLDSLFRTKLYDYDITFLINDDGSNDPRVREIINRKRDDKYRIIRNFTPKGHNSWGAAFNKAVKKLIEIDNFDIIGTCDSDVLFHPEWLDNTMKIALWAKENHKNHVLGPFSSFNSSDYEFHKILGTYESPFGRYVVKERMGALNYIYFKEDFLKLGYYPENKDDETLMTEKFKKLKIRYFSTKTSYIEHIGQLSVLNQWRPVAVGRAVHGMYLAKGDWGVDMEKITPYAYYKYLKGSSAFGDVKKSDISVDVMIPVIKKDLEVLSHVIESVRKNLLHPIGDIIIVGPNTTEIKEFCKRYACVFRDEDSVLPIKLKDINYSVNGIDRSGWIFQQLLKLNADQISNKKFVYIVDADTVLLQSQKFENSGKMLLLASDEYHLPYFKTFEKIFGYSTVAKFSFVAHQMLFESEKIKEMKEEIEKDGNDKKWYEIILQNLDKNESSSFSEYETYGNWMMKNYPNEIFIEYWHNHSLSKNKLKGFKLSSKKKFKKYRSVSFHSYNKNFFSRVISFWKSL